MKPICSLASHVRASALLLFALVGATACGSTAGGAATQPSLKPATPALVVTSSIADGSTLTEPVAWTATANSGLSQVEYLVDGVSKWTEYKSPYFFNDDGNLLHPWLLGAGAHVLTVRAVATSGAIASSLAHVTVTTGPAVPSTLAGTFTRSVVAADYARTEAYRTQADINIGQAPEGVWTAHLLPTGLLLFDDPKGSGGSEALSATADGMLRMGGPVNWMVAKDRWGSFCEKERPGEYRWSVSGHILTITGSEKKCADRDSVFIGTWTQG